MLRVLLSEANKEVRYEAGEQKGQSSFHCDVSNACGNVRRAGVGRGGRSGPTPAVIEQSAAHSGVQQSAPAAAPTEQKTSQAQAEGAIKIGETSYPTLQEAVDAVSAGTASDTVVTLTGDVSGNGVVVKSGTDLTLDLGGHTYTVDGSTVGSAGTETNGFQLLQNSDITFKNGTIKSDKAVILIQNYSNLTLDGVSLEGGKLTQYTLSNNNGNTVIGAGTNVKAGQAAPGSHSMCADFRPTSKLA